MLFRKPICVVLLVFVGFAAAPAAASLTYDFENKGATFDGQTSVAVPVTDGSFSATMTVTGTGGNLNSNAGSIGIGDDQIDGTGEAVSMTFNSNIDLISIDMSGVGTNAADGARLTIGATSIDLFTGVSGFNGTSDTYTPASPIRVASGTSIILTGSTTTSSFGLQTSSFSIVPEPTSLGLFSLVIAAGLLRRHGKL